MFFDHCFCSHSLLNSLKEIGILSAATIRANRLPNCNFLSDKDTSKASRGTSEYRNETVNNIIAVKWFDNKFVHLASSY